MAESKAVDHNIPLQNPISDPPDKPSSPPPQPPSPPPPSTESMPPPPTTTPVSTPPPPATAPVSVPPPDTAPVTVPLPEAPPAAVTLPPKTKKRSPESNALIQDSAYFKIRAMLKDMRPRFLEVVRAEDFRDCKAADELRERLKLLMELYKQMTAEGVTLTKCRNGSENGAAQKPEQLPADNGEAIDIEEQSCYTGGSAFGWNFIMFAGQKAVYYGRTKESFRAAQAAL
ncbi:hypothetical protein M5689_004874 [Euphorbia peplus]|nr:hypothetical protein M5689_004874 [Euphorbia peplus]